MSTLKTEDEEGRRLPDTTLKSPSAMALTAPALLYQNMPGNAEYKPGELSHPTAPPDAEEYRHPLVNSIVRALVFYTADFVSFPV